MQDACLDQGIVLPHYTDGQHAGLLCPFCEGGSSRERTFSVKVETVPGVGMSAVYHCFRASKCGASGRIPSSRVRIASHAIHSAPLSTIMQASLSLLQTLGARKPLCTHVHYVNYAAMYLCISNGILLLYP